VVALVGEVEGGRMALAPLALRHPLLGAAALQQQVASHYLRAALPELVKLVGSASVLGARAARAGPAAAPRRAGAAGVLQRAARPAWPWPRCAAVQRTDRSSAWRSRMLAGQYSKA
jgi:hypothetical protein